MLCDVWDPTYCNHGDAKERVYQILNYFHTKAKFLDGDSKLTVPTLHGFFDLVLVDADHSALGARVDLMNAWPRVRLGGILVMDDINHPNYPWLSEVWEEFVQQHHLNLTLISEEHGGCNAAMVRKR